MTARPRPPLRGAARRRPPLAVAARRRRRASAGLALAALAALAFAAPARAGTFRVSQCNAVDRIGPSPRGYQASLWSVAGGWPEVECGAGSHSIRIGTGDWRILDRHETLTRFSLPPWMPATTARIAWLDWRFNPQAPSTNPAYLVVGSSGARLFVANPGDGSAPGRAWRLGLPEGARGLDLRVWCSPLNGPGWCNWHGAPLEIRGLTAELEEHASPSASASGPLLAAGPRSGVEPLEIVASDGDSGVRRAAVSLGREPVGTLEPADGCRDDRLPPCPQTLRGTVDVDTTRVPDGTQRLRIVVTDAAGNARTLDPAAVEVRNQPQVDTPPSGGPPSRDATAPPPDPGRPGPAAPPRRLFPPNPLAGRGHVPNGRNASARARVRAWLEPPAGGRRRTAAVPYGVRVRIRGRVSDPAGRPVGRATLAAVRRERGGPWQVVTGVRTRPNGRFTAFTRIGPSQDVRFVYYAYGDSRTGRRSPMLRVSVRRE